MIIHVVGSVSFLHRSGDKSNLQIFVFGRDLITSHPTGIRCSIDSNGRMVIASDHVDREEVLQLSCSVLVINYRVWIKKSPSLNELKRQFKHRYKTTVL